MKNYCDREWLNMEGSSSTGSVVAFNGLSNWGHGDNPVMSKFLEIADCHQKIRLHQSRFDSNYDFLVKMKKLKLVIDKFIGYLEQDGCHENTRS